MSTSRVRRPGPPRCSAAVNARGLLADRGGQPRRPRTRLEAWVATQDHEGRLHDRAPGWPPRGGEIVFATETPVDRSVEAADSASARPRRARQESRGYGAIRPATRRAGSVRRSAAIDRMHDTPGGGTSADSSETLREIRKIREIRRTGLRRGGAADFRDFREFRGDIPRLFGSTFAKCRRISRRATAWRAPAEPQGSIFRPSPSSSSVARRPRRSRERARPGRMPDVRSPRS